MREILYFQAGTVSNYVGTHFWNEQESYFTYGEDAGEPLVDHDISFREGLSSTREPTFCPRLLLFDRKSQFGPMEDLYGEAEGDDGEGLEGPWDGGTVQFRQDVVPKSDYHARVDLADAEASHSGVPSAEPEAAARIKETEVRYWSDYSRVYFHPRSLQRLPDPTEWEISEGNWMSGIEEFERMEEDQEFMEQSFRPFVEECDNLQGIQLMNDTSTFGSFTHTFLTRVRDDFSKLSILSFPILSDTDPEHIDVDDSRSGMKILNDILCLRSLGESATITVPLRHPSSWARGTWSSDLHVERDSVFQTSAIISTHLESVTLPARLRSGTDMTSLCSLLNWRDNTRFAALEGCFAFEDTPGNAKFDPHVVSQMRSLSLHEIAPQPSVFARVNVSRGFTSPMIASYDEWAAAYNPPPFSSHAPAYHIPTSYPRIFGPTTPESICAFSSLTTSSCMATLFDTCANFVETCSRRQQDIVSKLGLDRDELRELRDYLWEVQDAYKGGEYAATVEAEDDD